MSRPPFWQAPSGVSNAVVTWDRLAILFQVVELDGKATFQSLRFYSGMSPGSLGNHLAKLEEAGLVRLERSTGHGRPETSVFLTDEGLRFLDDFSARIQEFDEEKEKRRSMLDAFRRRRQ